MDGKRCRIRCWSEYSRIQTMKKLLFTLAMLSSVYAKAQVINAASCSATDVQTALSAVVASTTTVIIPACTVTGWATTVTLTVPSGSTTLSILGAGNSATGGGDLTRIGDGIASSSALLQITTAGASSKLRISGITFQGASGGSGNPKFNGMVQIEGLSQNVRFDHAHVDTTTYSSSTASSGVQYVGCIAGVTDHSLFDNPSGSVNNSVRVYNWGNCNSDTLGVGDQSWATPTNLGSAGFMFVENNVFNSGAANDCTDGGRYVWRFNTHNMTSPAPSVQTHPTGGGGRIRGCRAWEIYQNTFNADPSNYIDSLFFMSSGTGVIWGNTIPSSSTGGGTGYKQVISAHSMRTDNSTYTQTATPNGWGYCGTNFNTVGSNWDQNSVTATGYHCLDQPGRGEGDLLTGGFTADGSGSNNVANNATGCISSATCAYPRQALEPVYEWTDNYSPVPSNPSFLFTSATTGAFVNNTDYYLWCNASSQSGCTSFTGATGTGSGVLSARPGTCTTGVAYWATDQGSWNNSGGGGQGVLYTCTATNTWSASPTYTPFTYPHPLTVTSNTWYIKTTGGTASQCTGLVNAAYPGSGSGQPCAFSHPFWLLNQSTFAWNISAGDTVQFTDTGPYCWGQPAGGLTNPPSCIFTWSFCAGQETLCRPPAPPNNVHILGFGVGACHDSGHTKVTNATQIIGINDDFFAFALNGTSGVDMECLDISGAETCTQVGSGFSTVTQTQQTGTTATYSFVYDNGTPLVLNENLSVSGTTNSSGHFNFKNQLITGGTGLNDGNIATITSYAISGSTATFQNTGQLQNLRAGEIFLISGFTGGSTFLNGQIITVLSAGLTSSQFEATVTGSGSATATGQINTAGTFTITLASATIAPAAESGLTEFGGACGGVGVSNNLQNGIIFNFGPGNQGPDNLTLADISIHAISHNGIWGSEINSSTGSTTNMSDIYLAGNGESDWDTDGGSCGAGCESQGTLNLNNIHAKWAGYVEVVPNGGTIGGNGYNYGVDQTYNGNGDCLVMIASAGTWNWSNSTVDHCGQDGFDFLHLVDDPSSGIILNETNLFSQFAEGQTIKAGGTTVNATNEVGTGSCNWPFDVSFPGNPPGWNALIGQTCRASDGMAFSMINGVTLNLSNIDNITMQSTAWDFSPPFSGIDCTTTCSANLTNVVTMGFTGNPNNPGVLPGGVFTGSTVNPFTAGSISHTQWWQMKTGACPSEPNVTNCTYGDPLFTAESSINAMNIVPATGSPLIGAGVTYSGIPLKDIFGVTYSSPPPIGAAMQAGAVASPTQLKGKFICTGKCTFK
jgi:hypothetical protein